MPEKVYFDSCVFIELLQQSNQDRFDACEELRASAAQGDVIIVTSAVAITEVNKLPDLVPPGLPEAQSRKILDFFENPYIAVRGCTRKISETAHDLIRIHGLTALDAIHVATALDASVSVFYTYDGIKRKRSGLLQRNGLIGAPPLRIEFPPDPRTGTLLDPKVAARIATAADAITAKVVSASPTNLRRLHVTREDGEPAN